MPLSLSNLFRLLVTSLLTAHVFYMYCLTRGEFQHIGIRPLTVVAAALFGLLMLIPLIWVALVLEIPAALGRTRQIRRWRANRCPQCGYSRAGSGAGQDHCAECNASLEEPQAYRLRWATLRRFGWVVLVAWTVGVVAGEVWISDDERRFRSEARSLLEAGSVVAYGRSRRWPNQHQRMEYQRVE